MGSLFVCLYQRNIERLGVNIVLTTYLNIYFRWNASRAFASYLDAHPELYRDKCVLELGAGGGLPGLVTVKNGAKLVSTHLSSRANVR